MSCFGTRKKPLYRKIVILGDGACGKTSLLNVFTRGYFPQVYEPTVFENYVHDIFVDSTHIELSLWDTAGQEEFDRLRSLSYSDTHVVMICFSIDSRDSLENVEGRWVKEVAEHCPGVKVVLVALKCDLREIDVINPAAQSNTNSVVEPLSNTGARLIDYDEGLSVAKRIKAVRYLECSAKANKGVNEAFTEAARVSVTAEAKGAHEEDVGGKDRGSGCVIC
ncbi:protein RHO3 [Saitoella complicata NRRL Y-17804]|uniref:GTP-binding protein RHO3 n=1 Tax=Saitoella complicata (strain BCRC 22490 / CBS 7301 / JCM 7358 / NBRC 10748 / NRRL Y-17804) TaxID=698492 RepID=A0A0E9NKD8_SAICN|nr:protein RHO3 [Saitoella complicata NRRL Y-17804]ODQ50495.1 protein RHO3 [Saitoella complicata NRRL Y-17804]GAO50273.1 hypothetical protein G7K_4403-t1 [Saitoella complicata NRRL Y-17804]